LFGPHLTPATNASLLLVSEQALYDPARMPAVSKRVEARVRWEFTSADADCVLRQLEGLHAEKQDPERYHAAVVLLARGETARVEWAAGIDWRDAFVWSGLGGNWEPRLDEEFGPRLN
jgi:hypothetical protein